VKFIEDDEYPLDSPQAREMLKHFPKMTVAEIAQKITCGIYQLEQARHYVDQHMDEEGGLAFYVHKSANDLIRARLQSRHIQSTKYFVWIKFENDQISGWYCQCKAGRRVVGCCAHVATLIWYFSYAHHINYGHNSTSILFQPISIYYNLTNPPLHPP